MQALSGTAAENLDADFVQDSWTLFARMRQEGPAREVVMPHGVKVWLVTRYDDVKALLSDPRVSKDGRRVNELFTKHSGAAAAVAEEEQGEQDEQDEQGSGAFVDDDLTQHILNTDPPRHTRLRKLVTKAFTEGRVQAMRPHVEEVAAAILDRLWLEDRREVELIDEFAEPMTTTVLAELLGVPAADRDVFRSWARTLVGSGPSPEEVAAATEAVVTYSRELAEAKRAAPGDDLYSALVQATDEGDRLTPNELVSLFFLLVVAGHFTSTGMIGNGMRALLMNPSQLALLRADPALLPGALEELLRFDGPVGMGTFRFTMTDVAVGGTTIPAGEIVVLSLTSANRDAARFENADELDVTRHVAGHLAFGHGIHYCVGAPLGRLMVEVAIGGLVARFPRMALAVPPEQLRWKASTIEHTLEALPVLLDG
ncbi:MAG: cytochrome P450 [Frankiaceae bacterium]